MAQRPTGTVRLLLTDIEGSARLWKVSAGLQVLSAGGAEGPSAGDAFELVVASALEAV